MLTCAIMLVACFAEQAKIEPAHAQNAVYAQVLKEGLTSSGETVELPPPRVFDGQDADAQRAALRDVAGSEQALDALLRDSVTAPFIIKLHDRKTSGATIRSVDLWFVVHSELNKVDFGREAAQTDQKEVEVANMWFHTRILKAGDLQKAGLKAAPPRDDQATWYSHLHARLLDRIDFQATNLVVATQSADSIVIASRTDPTFAKAGALANGWKSLTPAESPASSSALKPYEGGLSYAKISRLKFKEAALLIEMHAAFVEPDGWFQGNPILRSKFNIAAQDQIRSLRRELARKKPKRVPAPRARSENGEVRGIDAADRVS